MKKRFLSMLLAVVMLMGLCVTPAGAAESVAGAYGATVTLENTSDGVKAVVDTTEKPNVTSFNVYIINAADYYLEFSEYTTLESISKQEHEEAFKNNIYNALYHELEDYTEIQGTQDVEVTMTAVGGESLAWTGSTPLTTALQANSTYWVLAYTTGSNNAGRASFTTDATGKIIEELAYKADPINLTVGVAVGANVSIPAATGGTSSYTYEYVYTGLQDGLSIDANGVITGTPNEAKTVTVTVKVTDSANATTTGTVNIVVGKGTRVPTVTPSDATANSFKVTATDKTVYVVTDTANASATVDWIDAQTAGKYTSTGAAQEISGLTAGKTYYIYAYLPEDNNYNVSAVVSTTATTGKENYPEGTFKIANGTYKDANWSADDVETLISPANTGGTSEYDIT